MNLASVQSGPGTVVSQWSDEGPDFLSEVSPFSPTHTVLANMVDPVELAGVISDPRARDLMAQMARDIRTPLTAVLALAGGLQQRDGKPALIQADHYPLSLIYGAALTSLTLADDLLELARWHGPLSDAAPEPFYLREVFDDCCELIRPLVEAKGMSLRMEVPALGCRTGNPRAVGRVLLNLATNALKILERGEVELGARTVIGSCVEFWVSDSGPGFAAASLSSLCRPFRDDAISGKPRFSTAGLSLAICRKLLAAMDSELELETSLEEGSRFFFQLNLPVCDLG